MQYKLDRLLSRASQPYAVPSADPCPNQETEHLHAVYCKAANMEVPGPRPGHPAGPYHLPSCHRLCKRCWAGRRSTR